MCRLYGFLANEPTKVDCSLVYAQNALMLQSRVDEIGRHHTDGWGIVMYRDGMPVLEKKTTAAFQDQHFSLAAEKVYSSTIIAHVRKATVGVSSLLNTHPFVSGRWAFAHNGTITGFDRLQEELAEETASELQVQRSGQTDSEQYFLWLLTRIRKYESASNSMAIDNEPELQDVLRASVIELDERCRRTEPARTPRLNFVLTNGDVLIACRWNNSLHIVRREGIYDCEICGIPHIHHHETVNHCAFVVASEPVTEEEWEEVENQTILIARNRVATNLPSDPER